MVLADRPYQFFLAPVRTPEIIAWVAMGFVVDDAFAQKMRDLVGADVTLVAYRHDGPARIASTLPQQVRQTIATQPTPLSQTHQDPHVGRIGGTAFLRFAQRMYGLAEVEWRTWRGYYVAGASGPVAELAERRVWREEGGRDCRRVG